MIFKVFYQKDKTRSPQRSKTQVLYIDADSKVKAIEQLEKNTPYNIEYITTLEGKHLQYEKKHGEFSLAEF